MTASYIVIDTNVWIRQFLTPGGAGDAAISKAMERHTPVFDRDTLEELRTRLEKPYVADRSTPEQRAAFLKATVENSVVVERIYEVRRVHKDPDDDKFLGLAMTVGAANLISGDEKHLQEIKHYQGVQIWSPEGFLKLEKDREKSTGNLADDLLARARQRVQERPGDAIRRSLDLDEPDF